MSNLPLYIAIALLAAWFISSRIGKVPSQEARKLVADGARLIDVRSPGEFASGHLPGAKNVPVGDLSRRARDLGPKDGPVVVYCASGMRSASATRTLKSLGFSRVYDLGSMSRW